MAPGILIFGALGCADEEPWIAAGRACPADGDDVQLLLGGSGAGARDLSLTAGCRETLAGLVGMDDGSLELALEAERVADSYPAMLVGGMFRLLAEPLPSVDAWDGDAWLPQPVASSLASAGSRYGLGPDTPSHRLLFNFVADAIQSTELSEDRVNPSFAWWSATLYSPSTVDGGASTWRGATILLHEALHADPGLAHVACDEAESASDFDDSWDGAYGAAAYLLVQYAKADADSALLASDVAEQRLNFCDDAILPPCIGGGP